MYANLKVQVADLPEVVYAWGIEKHGDKLLVHLDANNGESSCAVEAGTLEIDPDRLISVEADF